MASTTFAAFQRHFDILPSRYPTIILVSLCFILFLVLYKLPFAPIVRAAAGVVVLVAISYILVRDARLALAESCVAFSLEKDGGILLIQRNGKKVVGSISSGGLLTPFLVLMNINVTGGGMRSIVLLPDSMRPDVFRRLRVLLKWERQPYSVG